MSAWAITLRFVLMLALVLNGTTSAVAGVRMATGLDHAMQTSAQPPANGHASTTNCHDHSTNGRTADHASHVVPEAAGSDRHPAPDCCKAGTCQCACSPCTQILDMALVTPKPAFQRQDKVDIPAMGHPAPALPNLIRPPIG